MAQCAARIVRRALYGMCGKDSALRVCSIVVCSTASGGCVLWHSAIVYRQHRCCAEGAKKNLGGVRKFLGVCGHLSELETALRTDMSSEICTLRTLRPQAQNEKENTACRPLEPGHRPPVLGLGAAPVHAEVCAVLTACHLYFVGGEGVSEAFTNFIYTLNQASFND